jgi:LysR family transcriptional regulator, low CO2-responsive transcriptional regulator
MRLSDLEALVACVREGSVTAAGRKLFLTQPAVSARLRRLEQEAGEPLLQRMAHGVRPTAAGERLAERAGRLLDELQAIERSSGGAAPLTGRLVLGATDLVAIHYLPVVLRRFRAKHPGVDLVLRVEGTEPLVALLAAGEIELALGTLPVAEPWIESQELFNDPLAIVAPTGHRLAGHRLQPRAVAAEPWISHKADSVTRRQVEGFFAAHGLRLRVAMEISNPEVIVRLVEARLGLAALPLRAVRREVREGRLAVLAVQGFRLERSSGLILRSGAALGRAATALRALFRSGSAGGGRPPKATAA